MRSEERDADRDAAGLLERAARSGNLTAAQLRGPRLTAQVLSLQARYGNQAVQRLLAGDREGGGPARHRSRAYVATSVQRSGGPPETTALATVPKSGGFLTRLLAAIKRSLAGRLLAAWMEARGASWTMEEGRLARQTQSQKIEKAVRGAQTPSSASAKGEPKPRVSPGSAGAGAAKGGLRVLNVVGVVSLAEDFSNIGKSRIPVRLEGLSAGDFPVGHEFKQIYVGDSDMGAVYVDVRVGRNVIGRRKFYIVNVYSLA